MALNEQQFLSFLDSEYGGPTAGATSLNDRPSAELQVDVGGPFSRAVARGTDNMQASMYGAANALGSLVGLEGLEQWGEEGVRRNLVEAALNPAEIASWDDAFESFGAFGTKVLETVGEQVPNLATMVAGGGAGAGAAKFATSAFGKAAAQRIAAQRLGANAAPEAVEALAKELAGKSIKRGAIAGAAAVNYPMQAGEVQLALQERGIDSPGSALLAGIPSTALDVFGLERMVSTVFKGFDRNMAMSIADQVGTALKERGLLSAGGVAALNLVKQAGKGAATGMTVEAPTEAAQELIKLAAIKANDPSFDIFSPEGLASLKEAAISGAVVGGVFSGVGRGGTAALNTTYEMLARGQKPPAEQEGGQDTPAPPAAPAAPQAAQEPVAAPAQEPTATPVALGPSGTVTETPEQLDAQAEGYARGERGVLYVDDKVTSPAVRQLAQERGLSVRAAPGGGVYLYNAADKARVAAAVEAERAAGNDRDAVERIRAELLEYGQAKPDIDPNANPRVRQTVGSTGQVIKEEVVDDNAGRPAANQTDVPVEEVIASRGVDPVAAAAWGFTPADAVRPEEVGGQPAPALQPEQPAASTQLPPRLQRYWQEYEQAFREANPGQEPTTRGFLEEFVFAPREYMDADGVPATEEQVDAATTLARKLLEAQPAQAPAQPDARATPAVAEQPQGGSPTITVDGALSWRPADWDGLVYSEPVWVEDRGEAVTLERPAMHAFYGVQAQIDALTKLIRCMNEARS